MVAHFVVAFGAVKPLFAAGCSDGGLNVEDVFAHGSQQFKLLLMGHRLFNSLMASELTLRKDKNQLLGWKIK